MTRAVDFSAAGALERPAHQSTLGSRAGVKMMKGFVLEVIGAAVLATGLAFAQREAASEPPTSRIDFWLVDPAGAVDGVQLSSGQTVYLSPSAAREATHTLRVADAVRLDSEDGHRWLVDARDESRIELTTSPARGGGPRTALGRQVATGAVRAWLRAPDGAVGGFVLATGEQVRAPSSLMPRVCDTVRVGDVVRVEGLGTRGPMGTGIDALEVTDASGRVSLAR